MTVELRVDAAGRLPELWLRPWRAEDMPALVEEMGREYPSRGLHPGPGQDPERHQGRRWTGPTDDQDAVDWLASQDRGWAGGGWLTFAVLAPASGGHQPVGHVALKNRDDEGRLGERETGEIGYWTAVASRGLGVAPAGVRAVTAWAFETFGPASLRRIMLVHDVDNPASCRVAAKAGYPYAEFSPANPPHWFADGHIHLRVIGARRPEQPEGASG
jgi:RimJ/RimL family protein N-acetyltransferase